MRLGMKWFAALCLSLMLWTVAAESTHHHPGFDDRVCATCLAAHTANPAPCSSDTTPAFAALGVFEEVAVDAPVPVEFSDSGSRAPPSL
jgi:hypothetical protein